MSEPEYRISFFTNTFKPFVGGVAMSADLYQRYLTAVGDEVFVYAPQYDGDLPDEENVYRVPSIRHFNKTDFSLPLPLTFQPATDFADEAFDIVHVHHPFLLGEVGMDMARQHRLPLVFTYHTQYEQYTHYVPVTDDVAQRTIIRHTREFCDMCDLVIAPTRDIQRVLRERGVTTRIEVLPTGIEMAKFEQGDPRALRQELGIEPDAPVMVHVGRLAKEKNLEFLVRACLRVLTARPKAHMVIVGEGGIEDELKQLAEAAGEPGSRVHFTGKRTGADLINAFCGGDFFVFASKTETQGMVVAEAMAARLPAVALDADGVRDLLRDGINGRLLPEDASEQAYAEAIFDMIDEPRKLELWRVAANNLARTLDMNILARRLHEHYKMLKLLPNRELKRESMSFGLIRNYFETIWQDLESWFTRL